MLPLWIVLGIAAFLIALWLFLIFPCPRKKATAPFCRPYAHRGLWGGEIPENSLAAFRRAAEAGFAVELDIQLSADGEVIVFHDYTLTRMCGKEAKLADLTAAQLQALRLGNTEEPIPTLREVLAVIDGRVPILIELKGESGNTALCPRAVEVLAAYDGQWCVESFNPLLLRWFKKHQKQVVRGILVTNLIKEKQAGPKTRNFALSALWLNVLCRPSFIAWDHHYPASPARRAALLFGARSFVYTVKDAAEYRALLAREQYPIFDGFDPAQAEK